jgi:hypothetical protein
VREYIPKIEYTRTFYGREREEVLTALASVLRDAERFKALESAFSRHNDEGMITVMRWKGQRVWHHTKEPSIDGATLAELADRLRESA